MKKMTDWFKHQNKPARPGVYEVKPAASTNHGYLPPWFSMWDGSQWLGTTGEPETAKQFGKRHGPTEPQQLEWRGFTKPQGQAHG